MHTRRQPAARADQPRGSRVLWGPDYEAFRRRLVQARVRAKMTQRDAAKALGRTPSYVAKSENGERRVDVVELSRFAKIYRRSLDYFLRPPGKIKAL